MFKAIINAGKGAYNYGVNLVYGAGEQVVAPAEPMNEEEVADFHVIKRQDEQAAVDAVADSHLDVDRDEVDDDNIVDSILSSSKSADSDDSEVDEESLSDHESQHSVSDVDDEFSDENDEPENNKNVVKTKHP